MKKADPILAFVNALRNCHASFVRMFTDGYCFELFKLIRTIAPDAQPWYDPIEGHVYTKVGEHWYDIHGKHKRLPDRSYCLYEEPNILKDTHRWPERSGWIVERKDDAIRSDLGIYYQDS